ncbi:MAG: hypothetical protein ACRDPL_14420 [Propionibacteriaceae bacterium]
MLRNRLVGPWHARSRAGPSSGRRVLALTVGPFGIHEQVPTTLIVESIGIIVLGVEVRGEAEVLTTGGEQLMSGFSPEMFRIRPSQVTSWGLATVSGPRHHRPGSVVWRVALDLAATSRHRPGY